LIKKEMGAVREILRARDKASVGGDGVGVGLGRSVLRERVLERFGVGDVLELLTAVHLPDPIPGRPLVSDERAYLGMTREKRLSSLSPLVFASAFEDGDLLALRVLRTCTGQLAGQVAVLLGDVVRAEECVICFGGSLFGVSGYREMVLEELQRRGHVFKHVEYVDDPAAVGAVGLAHTSVL